MRTSSPNTYSFPLSSDCERGGLTAGEARALTVAANKTVIKAGDPGYALPGSPATRSQAVRRTLDRQLPKPLTEDGRSYQLIFAPHDLTVHIVNRLAALGLLSRILREYPDRGAPSANRVPTTAGKRLADPALLWSLKNLESPGISAGYSRNATAVARVRVPPWAPPFRGRAGCGAPKRSVPLGGFSLPRGVESLRGTRQMCSV